MEKRKRFDDELLDLENPGADDSFLNEYLQDEESKKKLKKSSPIKTIKISFKKFSQPSEEAKKVVSSSQTSQSSINSTSHIMKTVLPTNNAVAVSQSVTKPVLPAKSSINDVSASSKILVVGNNAKENQEKIKSQEFKVINDKKLLYVPKESRFLGHILYTGAHRKTPGIDSDENLELFLLPKFSVLEHYALIQVRIPAEFLHINENFAVKANAVWGTDVYTDDSDVIAVHSGHFTKIKDKIPGNDINVTLRILPRLEKYQGSERFGINSRSWGSFHDGESFKIESVEIAPLGSARKLGRKKGSKEWVNQSTNIKDDAVLIMTSDEGWVKYSLKTSMSQTWTEKLKDHDLIIENSVKRYELSFDINDSKFVLSDKKSVKKYTSLGFNEAGIILDDKKIDVVRYSWRQSLK